MPKSENQKLKLFYIADYLMTETDEDHGVYVRDIREYLADKGIEAEEHSISRDIKLLRDVFELDIAGGRGKPYYLCSRYIDYEDISIIAECVGSSKFISNTEAERLVKLLRKFCSKHQADTITSEVFITERTRTTQKNVLRHLAVIKDAIHKGEKVKFKYNYHIISDLSKTFERRAGKQYTVSPFRIILNEGYFYLLSFDDKTHKVRTYRIDRMSEVDYYASPREGDNEFKRINLTDYTRQSFGMYGGFSEDVRRITITFTNNCLDTVLDRFGNTRSSDYKKVDSRHFSITTSIIPSGMFYSWVCGFGNQAVINDPPEVVQEFREYLHKIESRYEP